MSKIVDRVDPYLTTTLNESQKRTNCGLNFQNIEEIHPTVKYYRASA